MNFLQMLGAFRNPQAFVQSLMNNNQMMQNPMAKNAMSMYRDGNIDGLKQMAENLCKEKGTTVEEVQKSIMSQIGMQ